MNRADEYRAQAHEMNRRADASPDATVAGEYRKLAMGWLMLAGQVERTTAQASQEHEPVGQK